MPAYTQIMTDADLSQHDALDVASVDDLAHLAARLAPLDAWVHTMEVSENGKSTLDFAIMGLDGEEDWDVPMEPARMRALLDDKIAAMRASGRALSFVVYFGEAADESA